MKPGRNYPKPRVRTPVSWASRITPVTPVRPRSENADRAPKVLRLNELSQFDRAPVSFFVDRGHFRGLSLTGAKTFRTSWLRLCLLPPVRNFPLRGRNAG